MTHLEAAQRRRKIVTDWNAGMSVADIAIKYHKSVGAICSQLRMARDSGWSVRETDRSEVALVAYWRSRMPPVEQTTT